jgi:pectate lyase
MNLLLRIIAALILLATLPATAQPDSLVFDCFGMNTPGGAGGRTIHVTNYADVGPGSFREAVNQSGPRTIVFDIGGEFDLTSIVFIHEPYLTIDGETAPAPGVTFRHFGIAVYTHDVIIRHVRVRVGDSRKEFADTRSLDCFTVAKASNVWIDHCSASWSLDEVLDISGASNVTVSNCILAEGLVGPSEEGHSMAALIQDARNVALIGNVIVHSGSRTPKIGSSDVVLVNNAIYDPYWQFIEVENDKNLQEPVASIVGNVTIPGPSARGNLDPSIWVNRVGSGARIYANDNPCRLDTGSCLKIEIPDSLNVLVDAPLLWCKALTPLPSSQVEAYVRLHAGARPDMRDATDVRVIEQLRARTGRIIDSQSEVPDGWR